MREADEKGKYTKAEIEEAMLRLQFSLVEAKIRSDSTKLLKRLDFEDITQKGGINKMQNVLAKEEGERNRGKQGLMPVLVFRF